MYLWSNRLVYTGEVDVHDDIDLTLLLTHLANCLNTVHGRAVRVESGRVTFQGGSLWVWSWNVLGPFGSGDLTVDAVTRHVRYRVSVLQLVLLATILVGIMAVSLVQESAPYQVLRCIPFAWALLIGGNLAIGIPRLQSFVRRSINSAPRLTR